MLCGLCTSGASYVSSDSKKGGDHDTWHDALGVRWEVAFVLRGEGSQRVITLTISRASSPSCIGWVLGVLQASLSWAAPTNVLVLCSCVVHVKWILNHRKGGDHDTWQDALGVLQEGRHCVEGGGYSMWKGACR